MPLKRKKTNGDNAAAPVGGAKRGAPETQNGGTRAQSWYPLRDIRGPFAYRKDGAVVAALRVQPINLGLLSRSEKRVKARGLMEWLNAESEDLQIFCIGRPIDLATYQIWQERKIRETDDFERKQLLKKLLAHTTTLAASGAVTERRFYILAQKRQQPRAEEELATRLAEIRQKLAAAALQSEVCDEQGLTELYLLFSFPGQIEETGVYLNSFGGTLLAE